MKTNETTSIASLFLGKIKSRRATLILAGSIALLSFSWTSVHADLGYLTIDAPYSSTPVPSTDLGSATQLIGVDGTNAVGVFKDSGGDTWNFIQYGSGYAILNDPSGANTYTLAGVSGSTAYGSFNDSNDVTHGFLTTDGVNFTTIDFPNAQSGSTVIVGLDGSSVVGTYSDTNSDSQDHGFLFDGTNYTSVDVTNSSSITNAAAGSTSIAGVSGNTVAGNYTDLSNLDHGFLFDGTNYTTLDVTNGLSGSTTVVGISGAQVVGNYQDQSSNSLGFVFDGTNFFPVDVANSPSITNEFAGSTVVVGVSGGFVAGNFNDVDGTSVHGFLFDGTNYTVLDDSDPAAQAGSTVVIGVAGGKVYGSYKDVNSDTYNFVYDIAAGNYTTFQGPPDGTSIVGVSGTNAIGTYADIFGNTNAFYLSGTNNFTTVDDPLSAPGSTTVIGISGSSILGTYSETNSGSSYTYGFLSLAGTNFTDIYGPQGAAAFDVGGGLASLNGISGSRIAGTYIDTNSFSIYGFLLTGTNNYTSLYGPLGANAIDNGSGITISGVSGTLVAGTYVETNSGNGYTYGFIYPGNTTLYGPQGKSSYDNGGGLVTVDGVSGNSVYGTYLDTNSPNTYGYVYTSGSYISIFGPDGTNGGGIDSIKGVSGVAVAGNYTDTNNIAHGFLYDGTNYTVLDFPEAASGTTVVTGINSNTVYGTYADEFGLTHGFYIIQRSPQSISFGGTLIGIYGQTFSLNATDSSGLPIVYTVLSGPATISNNILTFTGAGVVQISATQSGNPYYSPAASVTNTVTASKGAQTISFPPLGIQTYSTNGTFALNATAPGAITYNSSAPNVVSVAGNVATIQSVGKATITATAAATTNYNSAALSQPVTVIPGTQPISFPAIGTKVYSPSTSFALNATAPGAITYASSDPTVVSISGNVATIQGAGTAIITASAAATANYSATTAQQSLTVQPGTQTVSFSSAVTKTYAPGASFVLSATAPGAITYASSASNVISISGNIASIQGAGTATITATAASTANYSNSATASQTVTVNPGTQLISFPSVGSQTYASGATFVLNATAPGAITYASSASNVISITGNTATIQGAGTATIIASAAATTNYAAATNQQVVNVAPGTQTVNFPAIGSQIYSSNATIALNATAQGAVTYTSDNPSVISINGTNATILKVGTAKITATAAATANFGAASVSQSVTVNPAGSQTINFTTIGNQTYAPGATITLSATAQEGSPTFSSSDSTVISINGTNATILKAGTVTITATVPATANFGQSIATQVVTVSPATQTLSFATPSTQTYAPGATFTLSATAEGTVTFSSSDSSVISIIGSTATILKPGSVTITASASATTRYSAATASQVVTVNAGTQSVNFPSIAPQTYALGATFILNATAPGSISYTSSDSTIVSINGNVATIQGAGTVTITATASATANYGNVATASQSVTVNPGTQTITFPGIGNQTYSPGASFVLNASAPGTISYTSSASNVISISGNLATILGTGSATITANAASTTAFASATATRVVNVTPGTQAINFTPIGSQTFASGATITLNATAQGVVTFTSANPSVIAISGNVATIKKAGTAVITASAASTTNYLAASATQSVTVNPAGSQTINFSTIGSQTYAPGATFNLVASAQEGTPTFTSSSPSVVSISGNTATILKPGVVTITATVPATANFGKSSATQIVTISPGTQTLTFPAISSQTYSPGATFQLSATNTGGGTIVYSSSDTNTVAIAGSTASILKPGSVTITANAAATPLYTGATASQTVIINAGSQSVTFPAIASKTYAPGATFILNATAPGAITYTSSDPSVVSVNSNVATIQGAGTATITATASATANYGNVATATQTVTVNLGQQTVSFPGVGIQTYAPGATFVLNATAPGAITYASSASNVITIDGNIATIQGAGTATISAVAAATPNYAASTNLQVVSVVPGIQSIVFGTIGSQTFASNATINLNATAQGVVTFVSSSPSVISINGNIATIKKTGTVVITATANATANYKSATSSQSVTVNPAGSQPINFSTIGNKTYSQGAQITLIASSQEGTPTFTSSAPSVISISGNTATILKPGTAIITATVPATTNFGKSSASQVVTVAPGIQTLTFPAIADKTYALGATFPLSATNTGGGVIIYSTSSTNVISISGSTAKIANAGTVVITATAPATPLYAATSTTQTVTVNPGTQNISFNTPVTQTFVKGKTFQLNATAPGPITYTSSDSSVISISGKVATIQKIGTATITATAASTPNYGNVATASQSVTVKK